ncbi:uncharacterized protein F4812DRAFT_415176 [Daldinia caldariorum]|uniref:uncharacterized protein n=1 Tax=Daldinia caldariorum TaxID=326644 RepID=UPI0020084F2E|nr:uncharacterized protein F4812DRAFT_415176 [Daldinia caldariorum]KAI1471705.1 hypothetical protein F4812DRAFT_415176 [Daldinia caldariorum]
MVRILQTQLPLRVLSRSSSNNNNSRRQLYHRLYRSYPLSFNTRAMSSAPNSNASASAEEQQQQQQQQQASESKIPLPLPEPDQTGDATQVSVGGEAVKLDHLGPLVINEDGTMSRISNWAEMAEIERNNTLRILGKRNKMRLDALRAKGQAQPSEGQSGNGS